MRLNITIDDETAALVKEMADAQSRTITSQVRHLIRTNNEVIGWLSFKANPMFQEAMLRSNGPAKLDK